MMSVAVLYLTNGFLVLILRVLIFLFLSIIADFMSSFCFVFELSQN